jgi:hypothetical protein
MGEFEKGGSDAQREMLELMNGLYTPDGKPR